LREETERALYSDVGSTTRASDTTLTPQASKAELSVPTSSGEQPREDTGAVGPAPRARNAEYRSRQMQGASPSPQPVDTSDPAAEPASTIGGEVSLLRSARRALHSDPAATLAQASEHARKYPSGLLSQESEVLSIEALIGLGRLDEARGRATIFLAAHPDSSHAGKVRRMLSEIGSGAP
jgi:hypothetical protein